MGSSNCHGRTFRRASGEFPVPCPVFPTKESGILPSPRYFAYADHQSMLSQTIEYALRASLHIARSHPNSVRVTEIADATDAPRNYLAKILGQLARAGLLESTRGPTGGFRFSSHP